MDNGSLDETQQVLAEELAKIPQLPIRSIRVEKNIGYGFGVMSGVHAAKGDIIAWTHADLQTDVRDIFDGYQFFLSTENPENTFLKGKRKNRHFLDALFTHGMAALSSIALNKRLDDINAQPKMFHVNFLKLMRNPPNDFSLDLYALYLAVKNNFKILEIPVCFNKRLHGEAKGGGSWKTKIRLIRRTCKYIFQLKNELLSGER